MATVAATVIDGTWEEPTLVLERDDATSGGATSALDAAQRTTIDALMRTVVERGTATAARPATDLRGKTGTAEFGTETPPRTHAWFIGYRNDLAAAILLEDGGVGGEHAAPVAGDLFSRLGAAQR